MHSVKTLALWGTLAPCFALALSGAAIAQTATSSSPAEKAQTQQLNQNADNQNADTQSDVSNTQYQAQQQQYQDQQQQYRANQRKYEAQAARYETARERYAAERASYHRDTWPARYEHSIIVNTADLMGARVQTSNGRTIGHVEEIAQSPNGHVDALRVALDSGNGDVWVDAGDLRFDANEKLVMTDLDRRDLRIMSRETF
ncbi:MAG: PRC-barrel domain-containing protein [Rhizomicrobium sp.]|jgi:multidrug efflux pump subunit AcrA (membrane-fusion protein)